MAKDMFRNFVEKEIMPVRQQVDDDKEHKIAKSFNYGKAVRNWGALMYVADIMTAICRCPYQVTCCSRIFIPLYRIQQKTSFCQVVS
jgi:hypothetical protein